MTEPTPTTAVLDPTTAQLDQAIIDAGYELANAHRATPPDPNRIQAARSRLEAARTARWPDA